MGRERGKVYQLESTYHQGSARHREGSHRQGNARRRKAAYRKRHQNRFSMFLVSLVVVMILVLVQVGSIGLQHKIDAKAEEAALLDAQIEAEEKRSLEIAEFGKEVQTKGYIEKIAREKLGLVYEGEILFKQDN